MTEANKTSGTPRTDAREYDSGFRLTPGDKGPYMIVSALFAKQLERELNEAILKLEKQNDRT